MKNLFKKLKFQPHPSWVPATQAKITFDNGYGASVISGMNSYSSYSAPYELGVLGPDGHLTYDTPITNDVIGYLKETEVNDYLNQIAALPALE